MCKITIKTLEGFEEAEGRLYKGIGIVKKDNHYFCYTQNGIIKGYALTGYNTLKIMKKFIDELLEITTLEKLESDIFDKELADMIAQLRVKYW